MIKDGLWDAFNGYHMGNTAENVAREFQITREKQDEFAVALAEQGRGGAEGRQVQGRDRARDGQDAKGRHRRRRGRVHPGRHDARRGRQAQAGLRQGRHGHRGQRLGHQRRRRGGGADDRRRSRQARRHAARPDRLVGDRRRRSGADGHRADPRLAEGAGEGRLEGRRPRPGRGQRGLRGAGLRGQQGHGLGSRTSSTSMAAPSPSAIRSAPRARACW